MLLTQVLDKQRKSTTLLLIAYSISGKNLKLLVPVTLEQSKDDLR